MTDLLIHSLLPLAQAPAGGLAQFLPLVLLFAGMWFLVIAPQRKRQEGRGVVVCVLRSGDAIVTSGGIHGTITNVKDDIFVVRIADNVKIELTKNSVGSRTSSGSDS